MQAAAISLCPLRRSRSSDMLRVLSGPRQLLRQGFAGIRVRVQPSANIAPNGGYNWSYLQDPAIDAAVAALPGIADEAERQAAVIDTVQMINDAYVAIYASQPKLAQPVLDKWDVQYEVMDYNYVVRFFYTRLAE